MEDMIKVVNEIVEDRFRFIQEHYEHKDLNNNNELMKNQKKADNILRKIEKMLPSEEKELIYAYDELITDYWVRIAEYYFKKGVKAGIRDINYIKEYAEVL